MSRGVLPGEHYCGAHQGNTSHYEEHNCVLCKLKKEVAELKVELAMWRGPECTDVDCPDYDAEHPYHRSQKIVGFEHGCAKGRDELATANDKVEHLEKTLLLLGDHAVVDWDAKMIGAVDALGINVPPTYKEWARSLFKRAARTDKAEARVSELELVKPDLMPQHLLKECVQGKYKCPQCGEYNDMVGRHEPRDLAENFFYYECSCGAKASASRPELVMRELQGEDI